MGLPAVRVHIAGSDFYVLPVEDGETQARELAAELEALRDRPGGALRLRPRTAPPHASWVREDAAAEHLSDATGTPLTGHEDPGTSWRDVRGPEIGDVAVVDLDSPVALWHWAMEQDGETERTVG